MSFIVGAAAQVQTVPNAQPASGSCRGASRLTKLLKYLPPVKCQQNRKCDLETRLTVKTVLASLPDLGICLPTILRVFTRIVFKEA